MIKFLYSLLKLNICWIKEEEIEYIVWLPNINLKTMWLSPLCYPTFTASDRAE